MILTCLMIVYRLLNMLFLKNYMLESVRDPNLHLHSIYLTVEIKVFTAIAFSLFAEEKVQFAVIEVD